MSLTIKTILIALVCANLVFAPAFTSGQSVSVFETDFSSTSPELTFQQQLRPFDVAGSPTSHTFVDVTTLGLTGQWLISSANGPQTATINLSGLPAHESLNIGMFLAPGGGLDAPNDGVQIRLDGVTVFDEHFHGRVEAANPGYGDTLTPPEVVVAKATNDTNGSEFIHQRSNDGWSHDSLYDLSLDPQLQNLAHTADTATIEIITNIDNGPGDEYFGIANLKVEANLLVPEPSSISLLAIGLLAVGGLVWRRRRRTV